MMANAAIADAKKQIMMEEGIKSITEAYSMQPETFSVVGKPSNAYPEKSIKEIKEMQKNWNDEQIRVYIGYNFEGKKLFEYLANSVNVHYK